MIAGVFTILGLHNFTFITLAFPAVLIINCSTMVGIIVSRRQLIAAEAPE